MREQYKHLNPTASVERLDGAVFRLNYERELRNKQIQKDSHGGLSSPTVDFGKKAAGQVKQKYYHFGPYKYYQIENAASLQSELKGQWTCCLKEDYYARGCCVYNYENKNFNLNKNGVKLQKIYKFSHPGIYQQFGFEKNDRGEKIQTGAWSCCQNEDINSKGCNKELVDAGRWNYLSFVSNAGPANLQELKKIQSTPKLQ